MSIRQAPTSPREIPIWFGKSDRPLFGWLTVPGDGLARAGVVLTPTIAREAHTARRALRSMAVGLAAQGLASLRFDFDGTGDSAGDFDDHDRVAAWTDDVASAVGQLRACGLDTIHAVGMRMGATILAAALDRCELGLDGLVLWDPCESGRGFLRELRALEQLRHDDAPERDDGSVETAEFLFADHVVAELRVVKLSDVVATPMAAHVLVVERDDRRLPDRLHERLDREQVEWLTTTEQLRLINEEPLFAEMPMVTIRTIVRWLKARGGTHVEVTVPDASSALVASKTGRAHEHFASFGELGLFGIVTEPTGPAKGPLMVLLNVSNEEHTGPSRLWVTLARRWAAVGLRSVRFDVTGIGDSPIPADAPPVQFYERPWYSDVESVARSLSPADPGDVVFVGLCSGAVLAVEGALALGAAGVCLINPPSAIDFLHGMSRIDREQRRPWSRLVPLLKQVALHLRWVSVVLLKGLRLVAPSYFGANMLRTLAQRGTDVFVLGSYDDISPVPQYPSLNRFFGAQFVAPSGFDVTLVPDLDHSMHVADGRERSEELLFEHVLARHAPRDDARPDGERARGATAEPPVAPVHRQGVRNEGGLGLEVVVPDRSGIGEVSL